jgi:hypothetical protein
MICALDHNNFCIADIDPEHHLSTLERKNCFAFATERECG